MTAAEELRAPPNPPVAPPAPDPSGQKWGSSLGVILAVAGSAVGLGNYLRFPGLAVENGGGAFMIPYFVALLLLGIPLGWAEWTMGRYGGLRGLHSAPAIIGIAGGRVARYLGTLGVLVPLVVFMYYSLVETWCLRYAIAYLFGELNLGVDAASQVAASSAFLAQVSGSAANGSLLASHEWLGLDPTLVCFAVVVATNAWLVQRGLSGGIELFCRYALSTMAICSVIVLIRVLTLGTPDPAYPDRNVLNGLGFLWNPDYSRLGDFKTWLAAAGQIFFTLSVGAGVILNYASYMRRQDDIVLSGLTAAATNETFEIGFGGLITVTAAFVFLGASVPVGSSFALGFSALPVVFANMGSFGTFAGFIWFFTLFLAAITSSIGQLQPQKAFIQEALGLSASRALALVTAIGSAGALWVLYFSKDLVALGTMDFWVGTVGIFLLGVLEVFCFSWLFGVDRGLEAAHEGAKLRIPRVFRFILKYVAPAYLMFVFVGFCTLELGKSIAQVAASPVAAATLGLVAALLIGLLFVTYLGERRWRALGLDIDGPGEGAPR